MSKEFLKVGELQLINGGYLSNAKGEPVTNTEFVKIQKLAEYVITFAAKAKGKDFVGKKAYSLSKLQTEVAEELSNKSLKAYIQAPKAVKLTTTDKLKSEAFAFMNFTNETERISKLNLYLSQFKIIDEFEEFGLFFEQDIIKLNRIYTMKEVISAVNETYDLLF